jgi:hypothetical protein
MTVPTSSAMAPSPLEISVLLVVEVVTCVLSSMLFKGVVEVYSTVWSLAGSHNLARSTRGRHPG